MPFGWFGSKGKDKNKGKDGVKKGKEVKGKGKGQPDHAIRHVHESQYGHEHERELEHDRGRGGSAYGSSSESESESESERHRLGHGGLGGGGREMVKGKENGNGNGWGMMQMRKGKKEEVDTHEIMNGRPAVVDGGGGGGGPFVGSGNGHAGSGHAGKGKEREGHVPAAGHSRGSVRSVAELGVVPVQRAGSVQSGLRAGSVARAGSVHRTGSARARSSVDMTKAKATSSGKPSRNTSEVQKLRRQGCITVVNVNADVSPCVYCVGMDQIWEESRGLGVVVKREGDKEREREEREVARSGVVGTTGNILAIAQWLREEAEYVVSMDVHARSVSVVAGMRRDGWEGRFAKVLAEALVNNR